MNADFDLQYQSGEGFITVKYSLEIESVQDKMEFLNKVAVLLGAMKEEQALIVCNRVEGFPEDD